MFHLNKYDFLEAINKNGNRNILQSFAVALY